MKIPNCLISQFGLGLGLGLGLWLRLGLGLGLGLRLLKGKSNNYPNIHF